MSKSFHSGLTSKSRTHCRLSRCSWGDSISDFISGQEAFTHGFAVPIEKTNRTLNDGFIPNPKLRLREQVGEVMRFKHYSFRTEEAYWQWIRRYIFFHSKRHPREMGAAEVRMFLSHLASAEGVAGATQNQALNALVFLYRQVLHQPLGEIGEVDRVRRQPDGLNILLVRCFCVGYYWRAQCPEPSSSSHCC